MARFLAERQEIVDMCRRLSDNGYLAGTGGNIGVRVGDNLIAVTPSATDYYTMAAEDIVLLALDTLDLVDGEKTPTVEKVLHAHMLRTFPHRRASVHTHQPIASAVALLHEVLPWPDGVDLDLFGSHVGMIPYRPSGTGMLASAFKKALKPGIYAYLLASHGAICSAADLNSAADMIRKIEAAASIHLRDIITRRANLDKQLLALVSGALEKAVTKGA